MTTFVISEQQNANSYRAGRAIECNTLTAAKISAKKEQFFQGTWLKIESEDGDLLALCDENGSWKNGSKNILAD